ncbi:Carrier domain-containing protein OS=Streptomyces glaucescens OX=1907 GN=SGLAU_00910 PE=4 SV=1 [Streptomyces glaucescens]
MRAGEESVLDGMDRAVREMPDNEALRTARSAMTYRELGKRTDEFAHRLRQLTRPGECVALLATRSAAAIVAMIGAMKAQRPFVFVDERDSDASNAAKTGLLGVRLLARGADDDGHVELTALPPHWRTADGHARLSEEPPTRPPPTAHPHPTTARTKPRPPRRLPFADGEIGYAIHTSGSTGTPKCVLVRAAPLAPVVRDHVTRLSVGPGSRTLQFARLTFDGCLTEILWTLTAGACLVVVDEERLAPGPVLQAPSNGSGSPTSRRHRSP